MSGINDAIFEGGTSVVVDSENQALAPEAKWTLGFVDIVRSGTLVAVHIEAAFQAGAGETIAVLSPFYAPKAIITDSTKDFELGPDGTLVYLGSTANAGTAVAQFVFSAGDVSPD